MSPPGTRKAELLHEIFAGVADALGMDERSRKPCVAQ